MATVGAQPLKETQLHKLHASNPASFEQHNKAAQRVSQPGDGQEQAAHAALARLRSKRAEQRLTTAGQQQTHVQEWGTKQPAPHSRSGASMGALGTGTGTRRRAQIVTTAGSGMQRQAPSCSSSAACSVRGCLELQQQPLRQLSGLPVSKAAALRQSWGNPRGDHSLLAVAGQQVTGAAGPTQQAAAAPAKVHTPLNLTASEQAGSVTTQLQVAGVGVDTQAQQPHKHPPQQLHAVQPTRHFSRVSSSRSRSAGLRPQGQQIPLAAGLAGARLPVYASAAAASGTPTATRMGCGVPWQDLAAAVAGAVATAATGTGRNLEHRRQVQQCRYGRLNDAEVAGLSQHAAGQLTCMCFCPSAAATPTWHPRPALRRISSRVLVHTARHEA
jgi:hypothetical protein